MKLAEILDRRERATLPEWNGELIISVSPEGLICLFELVPGALPRLLTPLFTMGELPDGMLDERDDFIIYEEVPRYYYQFLNLGFHEFTVKPADMMRVDVYLGMVFNKLKMRHLTAPVSPIRHYYNSEHINEINDADMWDFGPGFSESGKR